MIFFPLKKRLFSLFLVLFVVGMATPAIAEPSGDGGSLQQGALGAVGQPCRSDGSCVQGANCFELDQGGTICLFPGSSGASSAKRCPSSQRFLQCDDAGNCRLICSTVRGTGCHIGNEMFPFSLLSGWFLFVFLFLFRLARHTNQKKGL